MEVAAIPKTQEILNHHLSSFRDEVAYIAWSCESLFVSIPIGADCFIMENEKIKYQTVGGPIIPK